MSKPKKLLRTILSGASDSNISFDDLRKLLIALGFAERVRGDHFIYTLADIDEIINLQPIGSKAKAYQVKQVRNILLRYKLGDFDVS